MVISKQGAVGGTSRPIVTFPSCYVICIASQPLTSDPHPVTEGWDALGDKMAGLGDYKATYGGEVGELLTLDEYRAMFLLVGPAYVRGQHKSNTREGKQEFKHRPRGQGRKRRRW